MNTTSEASALSAADDAVTEELLRRPRRRLVRVVVGLSVLLFLVVAGVTAMRERTVYFMAPESGMTVSVVGRRARLPSGGVLVAHLRPGRYAIEVGEVTGARSEAHVSVLSTGRVFVPTSTEQCLVVASVSGLYEYGDGKPTMVEVARPGREVSAPFMTDEVVTDICSIPRAKKILSSLYVVQSAPCAEVPSRDAASAWLMRRAITCGL